MTQTHSPVKKTMSMIWQFTSPYKTLIFLSISALLVTSGLTLGIGQFVRLIVDQGLDLQNPQALNQTIIGLFTLTLGLASFTFLRFYSVSSLGERVTADLRKSVFNRLITLEPSFFEENMSGEMITRLTTDTTLLQSIIGSSLSFALRNFLMMLGGLAMLLITNIKLSLLVLFIVPVIILPMMIFGKRVRHLSRRSQDNMATVGSLAGELIQQIRTVQSYNNETYEKHAFNVEVENAVTTAKQRILNRSVLISCAMFLSFSSVCLILWVGSLDVQNGVMTAGDLAAFIFYAMLVAMGAASLSEVFGELQRAAGAAERLMELLNVKSKIQSPQQSTDLPNSKTQAHIELKNLAFNYPSRNLPTLYDINLRINPGESIAIVGPSGAGKSTLYELLLRFYDPSEGQILLNGIDIKQLSLQELRQHIAIVPQQTTLFSTDIAHNIRYGKMDADLDSIIKAAKQAHAHEFIEQLPQGYTSFLGEKGVRLSGGQKQRIILARAILNNPKVLLLDEATSALDAESEYHVQQALEHLMKDRTTLVIAHRLATVLHADRILVMDKGRIIAEGSHRELIKKCTLYKRLAELQFGEKKANN